MHCLRCDYDLRGVACRTCPECARTFDPADPSTWSALPARRRNRWRRFWVVVALLLCPGPLWSALGLGAEYLLAWSVLGHRPVPSIDDPMSIHPALTVMHMALAYWTFLFSPFASGMAIAIAGVRLYARHDEWRWSVLIGVSIACWPLAILVYFLYPDSVGNWWWD